MEKEKEMQAEAKEMTVEEKKKKAEELRKQLQEEAEKIKKRNIEADEIIKQGKGRRTLETPILSRDEEVKELQYDFTRLTGLEYTEAMDSDPTAQQIYRITYKQALSLLAKAAAKETDGLDARDIMQRIGVTDAVEGVQLATIFFTGSTRAGRMRILRR